MKLLKIDDKLLGINTSIFKPKLSKAALFAFLLIFIPFVVYSLFLLVLMIAAPLITEGHWFLNLLFIPENPVLLLVLALIAIVMGYFALGIVYNSAGIYTGMKLAKYAVLFSKISIALYLFISLISPIGQILRFLGEIYYYAWAPVFVIITILEYLVRNLSDKVGT